MWLLNGRKQKSKHTDDRPEHGMGDKALPIDHRSAARTMVHCSSLLSRPRMYLLIQIIVPTTVLFLCFCKLITQMTMYCRECFTRLNPAIVPPLNKSERNLQDENTGRFSLKSKLFFTVARRDPTAPQALEGTMSSPQLFTKALQALGDSENRLQ